jgi:hypothetical protein
VSVPETQVVAIEHPERAIYGPRGALNKPRFKVPLMVNRTYGYACVWLTTKNSFLLIPVETVGFRG